MSEEVVQETAKQGVGDKPTNTAQRDRGERIERWQWAMADGSMAARSQRSAAAGGMHRLIERAAMLLEADERNLRYLEAKLSSTADRTRPLPNDGELPTDVDRAQLDLIWSAVVGRGLGAQFANHLIRDVMPEIRAWHDRRAEEAAREARWEACALCGAPTPLSYSVQAEPEGRTGWETAWIFLCGRHGNIGTINMVCRDMRDRS